MLPMALRTDGARLAGVTTGLCKDVQWQWPFLS